MLANEMLLEKHTEEENPFDFTWMDKNGDLVVTDDNYKALNSSIKLVNCAVNNIAQIDGADNMKEYLTKALNEMLDIQCIFSIELDQRRRSA